jgi:hypothetical protein
MAVLDILKNQRIRTEEYGFDMGCPEPRILNLNFWCNQDDLKYSQEF